MTVTVMANGNAVENGRRTVPENREKVSFCLREKVLYNAQVIYPSYLNSTFYSEFISKCSWPPPAACIA